MPYISKKEEDLLLDIEQYIFTCLNFKRESFTDADEFVKVWEEYQALWDLNERLSKERERINDQSRSGMRKYRKDNPEKAKAYAKKYNDEYRMGKRRKEAK